MLLMTKRFKWLSVVLTTAIMLSLVFIPGISTNAEGWQGDGSGWWYEESDGSYPSESWKELSGKWYYFDAAGYMVTGITWHPTEG